MTGIKWNLFLSADFRFSLLLGYYIEFCLEFFYDTVCNVTFQIVPLTPKERLKIVEE